MNEKVYRIQIIVQEYESDGFWNIFDSQEMANGKKQLIEGFNKIVNNSKEYIEKRLI